MNQTCGERGDEEMIQKSGSLKLQCGKRAGAAASRFNFEDTTAVEYM